MSRSSKDAGKKKKARQPRPRHQLWFYTEEAQRDFVCAVLEIGMRNAPPPVLLLNCMVGNYGEDEVTSDRIWSYLREFDRSVRAIKARGSRPAENTTGPRGGGKSKGGTNR